MNGIEAIPAHIRAAALFGAMIVLAAIAPGCGSGSAPATNPPENAAKSDPVDPAPAAGGIELTEGIRENLGIRFIDVERRAIADTRRVPGVFELLPGARHEYRAPLRGRITPRVALFEEVQAGDLLATINSPQWRQLQHEAVEAEGEIKMSEARRDVARARLAETRALHSKLDDRLANLAAAGARDAALEAEATALRGSLPRLEAELREQEAAVSEAHEHYQSRLRTLASITGRSTEDLDEFVGGEHVWTNITELEVRAEAPGRVATLDAASGAWLEEGALVLVTIAADQVHFHAEAPQSDIGLYQEGQIARIAPAQGSTVDLRETAAGTLQLGLTANEGARTVSLYVKPEITAPWMRAGVAAFLEVTLRGGAREYWAIPKSAVIQDGLEQVYFRRDPNNPDRVLRAVADLGESDGRWVALRSGVKAGDQVVMEGAYALKLAGGTDRAPDGYHYHADGSLHTNH